MRSTGAKNEHLADAVSACWRFLKRFDELRDAEKSELSGTNPREAGALRRASMDLTRALARWRGSPR